MPRPTTTTATFFYDAPCPARYRFCFFTQFSGRAFTRRQLFFRTRHERSVCARFFLEFFRTGYILADRSKRVPIYGSSAHGNLRIVALMPGDILQQILRVLFFRRRAEYFGRFFEYVDFYRIRQTHFFRHAPDAVVLIRMSALQRNAVPIALHSHVAARCG